MPPNLPGKSSTMKKYFKNMLALLTLTAISGAACAVDSISVEAGEGNMASIYKLGVQNAFGSNIAFINNTDLAAYYEFSVAQIEEQKYRNIDGRSHSLTDLGFTPALRWQGTKQQGWYAEIGVGLNYMSEKYENNRRNASTQFQFGDHAGLGYQFDKNINLLLKFQHYSNADIKKPNPAINFVMLKFTYAF